MKRLPFIITCIVVFISVNAFSAFAADLKIAVMDTQRVYKQSEKITKYWSEQFAKDVEEKKQELSKKASALKALNDELNAAKPENMTAEEYREKSDIRRKEERDLKRMQEEIEAELKTKEAEMTRKFLRQIQDAAIEYREKEGLTLILEITNTLASDDAINVTDKVLKLFDSKP